ncbi:hypothetical protein Q7C36_009725 [Tachysurus vachellii]|uniref:Uncharacterized protein n=1 Tax=Tachysurus vachellii TaxID=175792 RepID=A0AA88MYL4_TACVA|nr:hypothetical protein Q7C36_009725 [Tachysurus vachellii]
MNGRVDRMPYAELGIEDTFQIKGSTVLTVSSPLAAVIHFLYESGLGRSHSLSFCLLLIRIEALTAV